MSFETFDIYCRKKKKPRSRRQIGKKLGVFIGLAAFLTSLLALDFYILCRPHRLRILLQDLLADTMAGKLTFDMAYLHPFEGLHLEGVRFIPEDLSSSLQMIRVDATVGLNIGSLLQGELEFSKIHLSRLRLDVQRDRTSGWSFPPLVRDSASNDSESSGKIPPIELTKGSVVLQDHTVLNPGESLVLSGIDGFVRMTDNRKLELNGSFRDRTFGAVDFHGSLDVEKGFDELTASALGFFPTEAFRSKLRPRIAHLLSTIGAKGSLHAELVIRPKTQDDQVTGTPPDQADSPTNEDDLPPVYLRLWGDDLEITPPDFPYAFPNVEGSVLLTVHSAKLERLRAVRGDTLIQASGEIRNYLTPETATGELRINADAFQLDSWLKRALPPAGQAAWDALSPHGATDLSIIVKRETPEDSWDFGLDANLRSVSMAYHGFYNEEVGRPLGFPYPLREVNGTIKIDQGAVALELRGRTQGDGFATIKGKLDGPPSEIEVDLNITAHRIPLDETLRNSLKDKAQDFYDRVHPSGVATAEIKISRERGVGKDTDVTVKADIHKASFTYDAFPYPVVDAEGSIHIAHQEFHVQKIRGRNGSAWLTISADIVGPDDDFQETISIIGENIPLNATLHQALSAMPDDNLIQVWNDLRPTGLLNVEYSHQRHSSDDNPKVRVKANVRDATVNYVNFPVLVTNVSGSFRVDGSDILLTRFDGRRQGSPVWLEGQLLTEDNVGDSFIELGVKDLEIDQEYLEAIRINPSLPGPQILDLDPSGMIDFRAHFGPNDDMNQMILDELEVWPKHLSISHSWLPARLTNLTGTLHAKEGKVHLLGLRGDLLTGTLTADGAIISHEDSPPSLELDIVADNLVFDDAAEENSKGEAGILIRKHHPRGKISAPELHIRVSSQANSPDKTVLDLSGALKLDRVDVDMGIQVSEWEGDVALEKVRALDGGYDFLLHTQNSNLRIFGYKLTDVATSIEAIEDYVRFREIRGRLYGGRLDSETTRFEMHTDTPSDYEGALRATGIQVREVFEDQGARAPDISGLADLQISFNRGEGEGLNAIEGSGQLRIYDAKLFRIPLLSRVVSVLPVTGPAVFTDVKADFTVGDGGFSVDPLEIYSVAVSVKGSGFMTFGGELDFSLASWIVPDLLSIPLIDIPFSLINRSLFGIRVEGGVESPKIRLDNLLLNTFQVKQGPIRTLRSIDLKGRKPRERF